MRAGLENLPWAQGVADVFMRNLDLPRGHERERVHDGDREYTLREGLKSASKTFHELDGG